MKKQQLDHVLRAAGRITGERQFVIIGSQSLPAGWKSRLVPLPPGDTDGVSGLCLDPHDLAIAKYVVRREKNQAFNRELAKRGIVDRRRLLGLVGRTPVDAETRGRIRADIERDFGGGGDA